jgi:hypothetical protein
MSNRDLLKGAIADAKAVKEMAINNAKAALEEAFTPQLKSMLEKKLQEMDEADEKDHMIDEKMHDDDETMSEEELNELLAELEAESEDLTEAEEDEKEEEAKEGKEEEAEEDEKEEEFDLESMSEEDLKAFVEEVVDEMIAAGELEGGEEEAEMETSDEEIEMPVEEPEEEEAMMEAKHEEDDKMEEAKKKHEEEKKHMEEELAEAVKVIKTLKAELNEINLLNSKLLYSNKIFKAKNLNEAQKTKVLTTFDKAETVKEVKLVYETLLQGLNTVKIDTKRQAIKESKSFASKAVGVATKQPVVETNDMVNRFQKLAGIK